MLKFDRLEMQRVLRLGLVQSEHQFAEIMRTVFNLNEQEWPAERLLAHTQRGLDCAVGWNLTTQNDMLKFLALRHQLGERFDEFPAVRKFLSRKDLPVSNRIMHMMAELPLAIWSVVQRRTPSGHSTFKITGL